MEEIERPEKRRKLDGEREDGRHVRQTPRSPRVVLNKINVDQGLLQRFRKIRNLAKQKLALRLDVNEKSKDDNSEAEKKNGSALENGKVTEDSPESFFEKSKVLENRGNAKQSNTKNDEDRVGVNVFLPPKLNNETVEVLDSSELWLQKSILIEKTVKRKRDENSNENGHVDKATKFLENKIGSIETESIHVSDAQNKTDKNAFEERQGTQSNNVSLETTTESDDAYRNHLSRAEKVDIAKDGETRDERAEDSQEKGVKVAKVAQDYAKSGAQTERLKDFQSEKADNSTPYSNSHSDEQSYLENSGEPIEDHADEALVYQLLKDVIEKQSSSFANNLLEENAKLEKRVEHLERENALLQKTSKRLHLALQAVFKNREKARQSRNSRAVQVNMSLHRSSFRKTPTVNIDIPEQSKPKENRHNEYSPSSHSSCTSKSSQSQTRESTSRSSEEPDQPSPKDVSVEKIAHRHGESDSSKSHNNTDEDTGGEPETFEVTVTTIGIQTQESTSTKSYTEGMGHFKLPHRQRYRGQPVVTDAGEKGHYKMTPHGLELKTKGTSLIKNLEETSQGGFTEERTQNWDVSKLPSRRTPSTENIEQERERRYIIERTTDEEKRNNPLTEKRVGNADIFTSATNMADSRRFSTSPARDNESSKTQSATLQRPPSLSSLTKERDKRVQYQEPQSPIIPKHSIDPSLKTVYSPKLISSPKNTSEEPDLIIVTPRETAFVRNGMPNVNQNDEASIRAVQNEVRSKMKEREMLERQRQAYAQSQARSAMPSQRNAAEIVASRATPNTLNSRSQNSQEILRSTVAHMNQIKSLHHTNAVMRARDQANQQNLVQEASKSSRHGAQEIRVADQNNGRENLPAYRGPGYPPHLISSQPQRIQEQFRPPRSVTYEMADQARQQGHPIGGIPAVHNEARAQRLPVPELRTQQPQSHPSQQQQHIVIRQPHRQQLNPASYQQPRPPPPYVPRPTQAPQQTAPRPQAQQSFQSPHHLQQVLRPMVVPRRSDPNMPLSPEFGRTFIPRAPFNEAPPSQPPHLIPGNVQQTRQGPVVVYQPGTLEGAVRPGIPSTQVRFEKHQDNLRQAQNPAQSQMPQLQQRQGHMAEQMTPRVQNQMAQRGPHFEIRVDQRVDNRRPQGIPERPQQLQLSAAPSQKSPPKPSASIAVVENGIVLSWNVPPEFDTSDIDSYELFACQDDTNSSCPPVLWKKIGVVKALPLPMACTLTQFSTGSRYQFAVRAVDAAERAGPFSDPCVITLKKP